MTELWLVRHGQTDWNLEKRYQGQTDIPLNQTGIMQAKELSQSLGNEKFAAIYSSDLIRAKMTADILAEKLELTVQIDKRLREVNQGEWEGKFVSEVRACFSYQNDDEFKLTRTVPPKGERVTELAERVAAAVDDISRRHPNEKILIVAHGLAVATLICQSKGIPLTDAYEQIPKNAREIIITWEAGQNAPKDIIPKSIL
jgi:broad specificity phosphatase PhoE